MHTKGTASKYIKNRLNLDCTIYLGNDLNDITMFSEALNDKDFIVIASNEYQKITNMLLEYLQEECKLKGIDWEKTQLLVLKDKDVNKFLFRMERILRNIERQKNSNKDKSYNKPKDISDKEMMKLKEINKKRKPKAERYR